MHSISPPGPLTRSPTPPRVLSPSSRPSALLTAHHPSPSLSLSPLPLSVPRLHAHMQREPDRPAGIQSPLAPCISESVSQSVSQSLSQSVGESGRSGTRERYHRSLLLLLSPRCTVCNDNLLSPLSFSRSLLFLSFLLVYSFLRSTSFFTPFPLFTRSLRSRAGDRVARPVRHGFSSPLSLALSLPRSVTRVHRPVRDVYFPRSRAAR